MALNPRLIKKSQVTNSPTTMPTQPVAQQTVSGLSATSSSHPSVHSFVCPFCGLLCDDLPQPADIATNGAPDVTHADKSAFTAEIINKKWADTLQAFCPKAATGVRALSPLSRYPLAADLTAAKNTATARTIATENNPNLGTNLGSEQQSFFTTTSQMPPCASVGGQRLSLDSAFDHVAKALRAARRPVFAGLGCDVTGLRAALALADQLGTARLVHAHHSSMQRNLLAVQSRGAITTTFAEVLHRADLILIIGANPTARFPRFLERIGIQDRADGQKNRSQPQFLPESSTRQIVLLGASNKDFIDLQQQLQVTSTSSHTKTETVSSMRNSAPILLSSHEQDRNLFDCISELRLAVANNIATQKQISRATQELAQRMKACRYGVIVWVAAELDFPGADILIETLHGLVQTLNQTTRWAALPLSGSGADLTAQAVATWQTGYSLPIAYHGDVVSYDAFPDYRDADLLLWLATLPGMGEPQLPGVATADLPPTIIIGSPEYDPLMPCTEDHSCTPKTGAAPAAYIPSATGGIHSSGHYVRSDSVITLYAHAQLPSPCPSMADILTQVAQRIAPKHSLAQEN